MEHNLIQGRYVRLTPNGTNPGRFFRLNFSTFWGIVPKCTEIRYKKSLFQIRFQYNLASSQNLLKSDLIKSWICPIFINLTHFEPKTVTHVGNICVRCASPCELRVIIRYQLIVSEIKDLRHLHCPPAHMSYIRPPSQIYLSK